MGGPPGPPIFFAPGGMVKKRIELLKDRLVVAPGKRFSLAKDHPTDWVPKKLQKERAEELLQAGVQKLAQLQDRLYAQDQYSLLLIFQAMDAAGKDGTIKHVMSGINPQGCQVFSFKAPTAEELDHDYLWRCWKRLPERGRIGIFNRSYYEEVLVVRVHPEILEKQRLPTHLRGKKIFERRYEEINAFEKYLHYQGTIVLKFFLNVSRGEQKKRFLERIEESGKNWKFSAADARERQHWDRYMKAYEDCLRATSTKYAPWFVVPADNKWFMRLAVAAVIYETLESLNLQYPRVTEQQKAELEQARKLLLAEKA
jgi:PPK2 family polyphosphate:nucleotide phosphotransferase